MKLRLAPISFAAFAAVSLVSIPLARAAAETFTVDTVHSSFIFRLKHMNTSYAYGRFNDFSGSITYDAAKPDASTVSLTIKTSSVDTGSADRDKHLRSPDFLECEKFPEMSFASTSVKKSGEALDVAGNLTMHGVTKPVSVRMDITGTGKGRQGESLIGFEGTFQVKRSEFGMDKMLGGIGDEVRITVSIEANHK